MSFKTEGQAQIWLQSVFRQVKNCYVQKTYLRFTAGFPDLIVGHRGKVAFYEVKLHRCDDVAKTLKEYTPIQRACALKMKAAGMVAGCLIMEGKGSYYTAVPLDLESVRLNYWPDLMGAVLRNPVGLLPTA